MITLTLDKQETYNDETNEFQIFLARTVDFEYSLAAVAKWEARWQIPFLTARMTGSDHRLINFYICMSSDPTLEEIYITESVANALSVYIKDPQTATTFNIQNGNTSTENGKVNTAEELYALMAMNGIPLAFEDRNLNRLLVILKIISVYNNPPKKMSKQEVLQQNAKLNAQRKKEYNTRG